MDCPPIDCPNKAFFLYCREGGILPCLELVSWCEQRIRMDASLCSLSMLHTWAI